MLYTAPPAENDNPDADPEDATADAPETESADTPETVSAEAATANWTGTVATDD